MESEDGRPQEGATPPISTTPVPTMYSPVGGEIVIVGTGQCGCGAWPLAGVRRTPMRNSG